LNGYRSGLIWIIVGAVIGFLIAVTLLAVARLRGTSQTVSLPPVLTVIPLPTATVPMILSPTPQISSTQSPTAQPDAPKEFSSGELVQVSGTGGEGLRMRANPSLAAEVLLLGLESEVFEVLDGPNAADGYTWWLLANPFDPTNQGWAADQFLRSLEDGQ
jgi:hypothetical protein